METGKKILIPLLCVALCLGLLRSVFFLGYVPSASMEPTLKEGSAILGLRIYGELEVGDIIVFVHEKRLLVKRIAACPGDEIMINDQPVLVPEGRYYVLGDNADNSYDSRYWANPFIHESDILAKVIC